VVFVCTHNSARSQLAAALWNRSSAVPAASAGTHPADAVHPRAVAAADAAGLDLHHATPARFDPSQATGLVITVCDRAHEELESTGLRELHWSVPDPARDGRRRAFDAALASLADRIDAVAPLLAAS
jgi:protein-tyrosine-phosphatase